MSVRVSFKILMTGRPWTQLEGQLFGSTVAPARAVGIALSPAAGPAALLREQRLQQWLWAWTRAICFLPGEEKVIIGKTAQDWSCNMY